MPRKGLDACMHVLMDADEYEQFCIEIVADMKLRTIANCGLSLS